jgi:hypothetical protein
MKHTPSPVHVIDGIGTLITNTPFALRKHLGYANCCLLDRRSQGRQEELKSLRSDGGDTVSSLGSSNNAILVNNCQNLENLHVTLLVTEDLVTLGNTGESTFPENERSSN